MAGVSQGLIGCPLRACDGQSPLSHLLDGVPGRSENMAKFQRSLRLRRNVVYIIINQDKTRLLSWVMTKVGRVRRLG